MRSYAEVDRLTLNEYTDLMEAAALHRVDVERDIHWQAFQNFRVKAMKGKGKSRKPVYAKFEKFFNHKAEEERVLKERGRLVDKGVFGRLKEHYKEKGQL